MVKPILRPLFQRMARGSQDPRARMFVAGGLGPLAIDSITDTSQLDITEDITDISNVTSNEQPSENANNAPVGPNQNSVNQANEEENKNVNSMDNNATSDFTGADEASTDLSNDPDIADYIDNDSVQRINNYKDVIKQFLGESSGGDKLQQTALLLQLGTALMSGRTDQPGLRGFFDVVGQAGAQTAPMLFQMGIEKQKADREINAAALDLYFSQMDKMSDRSGPYVQVYQNYKTNADGSLAIGQDGQPIKLEKPLRLMTVKRTSPEETKFYELNKNYGMNLFEFVEAGEGAGAYGLSYPDQLTVNKDLGSDANAQIKYANYVQRGLIPLANEILPMIIDRPDLIGASGEFGKIVGPLSEVFEEFTGSVVAGDFDSSDPTGGGFAVRESSNGTMNIDGVEIPVFIDKENKYGGNGLNQDRYGAALEDGGYGVDVDGNPARAYVVADSFTKLLQSGGERSVLETFETTLGLMLARDRQPTGRMLADVLRRSFADVKLTGIGGRTTDQAVVQNYMRIYNQLYDNMAGALKLAGMNPDDNPEFFKIEGSKNLENSYYNWLQQPQNKSEYLRPDVSGSQTYKSWLKSTQGNIDMNHQEDMQKNKVTHESLLEKWG
tara:strand:- start:1946 stop:3778 length:1833 start_codon:yes stop_codon:yes gene_type:complete